MENDNSVGSKKEKKINKIKEQLARLREKLKVDDQDQPGQIPKSKLKKIKDDSKPTKIKLGSKSKVNVEVKKKAKAEKKKQAKIKIEPKAEKKKPSKIKIEPKAEKKKPSKIKIEPKAEKKKQAKIKIQAKAEKKKQAKIKAIAKKKAKAEKKKQAKIKAIAKKKEIRLKAEAKKKAKEDEIRLKAEAIKKEEEAKKKEEEAKRTYEDELEEQLTEEEITSFQLEKTDMDKMCNRVCEIIADYESDGILQSQLWKKLKLSSRDGSRLALKLERMGMITREKILEKERWTYKLIIKKIPITTKSLEGAPCLTCPVESKCSIDGDISPKTCQWIEDWVMIELKNK